MRWLASGVVLAVAAAGAGCAEPLDPGEYGTFRYVGQVRGEPPLSLVPPVSDREGNVYVLYGGLTEFQTEAFVGHAGGGWTGGCEITGGNDFGAHGWVGRATDRAWYWSGEALVALDGATGGCGRVLEKDPASGSTLKFRAIVPWVRETPSKTITLAWVQALSDPVPYQVVVDLDNEVYQNPKRFSPKSATELAVLGVGGSLERAEGVVVVRYRKGESIRVEARFIDDAGETLAKPSFSGLESLPEYGIVGTIQANRDGLYAGLDVEGKLLVFDQEGGKRKSVKGMVPVGVHEWEGDLFVVGTSGSGKTPMIASIDNNGSVGKAQKWESSALAAKNLRRTVEIVDDRTLPAANTSWKKPKTALGPFPLVSPHSLDRYADATTTWLVAGPDFDVGGEKFTAIAFAPVGVSYP